MAGTKYTCTDPEKGPCHVREIMLDLQRTMDRYQDAMCRANERITESEKNNISTAYLISSLKDQMSLCRENCKEYTLKIDHIDRRVNELEAKFDAFTENITSQLMEIRNLLQETRSLQEDNEAAIKAMQETISNMGWINELKDTLLKKVYHFISIMILAGMAMLVIGFYTVKPIMETFLSDKFATKSEAQKSQVSQPVEQQR